MKKILLIIAFTFISGAAFASEALIKAAKNNDVEQLLLEFSLGADIEYTNRRGLTALAEAAQRRSNTLDAVNFLIKYNANLEGSYGEWKMTPLRLAIMNHNSPVALALIEAGANLVAPDKVGDPAAHGAIYQKDEKVLRALFSKGVDPFYKNDDGLNVVEFSFNWRRNKFSMDIILEFFPDICQKTKCEK